MHLELPNARERIEKDLVEYRQSHTDAITLKIQNEATRLQAALANSPYLSIYLQVDQYPGILREEYNKIITAVARFPIFSIHTVINSSDLTEITSVQDFKNKIHDFSSNCKISQKMFKRNEKKLLDHLKSILSTYGIYVPVFYAYDQGVANLNTWFFEVLRPQ